MEKHSKKMGFVAVFLVLFPLSSLGDDLSPALSPLPPLPPFFDKICEKVQCGKGRCKADIKKPLGFTCECDDGWKRSTDDDVNTNHTFLPCVIPSCNMNVTCMVTPPPAPAKEIPRNGSLFDPCYWIYCGGGTCKRDDDEFKHTCECNRGFTNLLNQTYFPCYGQCDFGSDCSRLITSSNIENSPSNNENPAASFLPGKLQLMTAVITSMAMVLSKQ